MTHQDILDAREALERSADEALRLRETEIAVARKALQVQCGEIGHVFARSKVPVFNTYFRQCAICECVERPKD